MRRTRARWRWVSTTGLPLPSSGKTNSTLNCRVQGGPSLTPTERPPRSVQLPTIVRFLASSRSDSEEGGREETRHNLAFDHHGVWIGTGCGSCAANDPVRKTATVQGGC